MLFALQVWLAALIILLPAFVDGLSWATTRRFYRTHHVSRSQKNSYLAGLVVVSASTFIYLGYFAWRICALYQVRLPFYLLIALDRSLFPAGLLSALAIIGFFAGRGPYRLAMAIAGLWVAGQIWIHGGLSFHNAIIHWA
jgi:uncharacterized membrane-anchored protein